MIPLYKLDEVRPLYKRVQTSKGERIVIDWEAMKKRNKDEKIQRQIKFKIHRDKYLWKQRHEHMVCFFPPISKNPINWRFNPFILKIFTYWPTPYYWKRILYSQYSTHWYNIRIWRWAFLAITMAMPRLYRRKNEYLLSSNIII